MWCGSVPLLPIEKPVNNLLIVSNPLVDREKKVG